VLAAPPEKVAELIGGELYLSPRPGQLHSFASGELFGELRTPFGRGRGGPGGWVFIVEPELHLGDSVLVPDIAAWRRERYPEQSRERAFFEVAPDWVCEALSPSTARLDRLRKLPLYAAQGVRHAWLVDAPARTLEAYRNEQGKWLQLGVWGDAARVRAEPFEVFELQLDLLWTPA
jgi:Uma2 family endonuclease